jgi:membrane protein YqaA with SNARE-associated domain
MGGIVDRLRALAMALGAPGLFLIAFLDSSFLSLPEIADILIVYMVTHHKHQVVWYVINATLGSMAGCLVMYFVGKKGGDALVRKRFTTASIERAMAAFRRHGVMAVLIPSLLPPPAPFKIFVLLAGVAAIDVHRFTAAIALGRGLRYAALGLLAVRYGDRALAYVHENGVVVSLISVGVLAGGFVAYLVWNRSQERRAGSGSEK